ncbi:MAG: S41 family peptidase [Chloroflexota bacterium]
MKHFSRSHTVCILLLFIAFMFSACARTTPPEPTSTAVSPTAARPTPAPEATAVPLPTPIRLGNYPLLSPEDMRYDLDELFHRLETTHPNPYMHRPKSEVDRERQRIYDELAQPLTMIDFFKKVAPLVNSLGDYHTQVLPPNDVQMLVVTSERFFPLNIQMVGKQAYITANYSANATIPLGAELLAINGIPLTTIQSEIENYFPPGRHLGSPQLWLLFGSLPSYQITILPSAAGTPTTQTIVGITNAEVMSSDAATSYIPVEPVTYATLPGESIGVLTLNTFGAGLGPSLKTAFAQIQADGVQHLILDVRTNSGGYYEQLQSLMDYLTERPYRWCSQLYLPPFGGYGSGDPRETDCEVIQPFATNERYEGKLYLLLGPDTFSAAIILATILQDYDLALLIGEETGDSASFCAQIPSEMLALPRTGLLYNCSRSCQVRPSGVRDDQPVVPDIIVKTTIADEIANYDPVMAYTLEMIRSETP